MESGDGTVTCLKNNKESDFRTMRQKHEALKADCAFRLANLEEENKRIKKKISELRHEHDGVVDALLPEKANKKKNAEFARDLTSFPLPDEILKKLAAEPVRIVDVGAFELEGQDDLYADLFARYPCEVFGFEPQNNAIISKKVLKCQKTILPLAIGDGERTRFYRTRYPAASSTFKPNRHLLQKFLALPTMLEVEEECEIDTRRLDDIDEIKECDLLKVDVQGGELNVFAGAKEVCKKASIIITEVEFAPIYERQPLFSDIDSFLRQQGFFLLNLCNLSYSSFRVSLFADLRSRLMWADAVYVKDPGGLAKFTPKKILMAGLIAHMVLRDPSLTCLLLDLYDRRTESSFLSAYQASLHLMRRCYG